MGSGPAYDARDGPPGETLFLVFLLTDSVLDHKKRIREGSVREEKSAHIIRAVSAISYVSRK